MNLDKIPDKPDAGSLEMKLVVYLKAFRLLLR